MKIQEELVSYHDRLPKRDPATIDLIVLHCTELPTLEMAREFAEKIVNPEWLTGNCGHYYIDRDGSLYRYVNDDRIANHVLGFNDASIGIEIINTGRYPNWFAKETQTMTDPYSRDQVDSLKELLRHLTRTHSGICKMARHSDLDLRTMPATNDCSSEVRRRIDPGPMFPWEEVHKSFEDMVRFR